MFASPPGLFVGAEDNHKALFQKFKDSKAGWGGLQRMVDAAFHYIAALMAKQGLIFSTLQKFNAVGFFH